MLLAQQLIDRIGAKLPALLPNGEPKWPHWPLTVTRRNSTLRLRPPLPFVQCYIGPDVTARMDSVYHAWLPLALVIRGVARLDALHRNSICWLIRHGFKAGPEDGYLHEFQWTHPRHWFRGPQWR